MAASGMIADTIGSIGYDMWKLASAIAVVSAVNLVRKIVLHKYHVIIKDISDTLSEEWKVLNSISTFFLVVMVLVVIRASRIVLDQQWIEQITSAMVVGIGFGLQGTIQDVVYGYIRRGNKYVMDHTQLLELVPFVGVPPISGHITHMTLNTFTFHSDKATYVLPWTALKSFKVVHSISASK